MNASTNNTFINGEHISGISVLEDALALKGNLNLKNYKIINLQAGVDSQDGVNVQQLEDQYDQLMQNMSDMTNYAIDQSKNYTDQKINDLKDYVDDRDQNILDQSKQYTDNKVQQLGDTINNKNYADKDYVNDKVLDGTNDAYNNAKSYTDTALQKYAKLDLMGDAGTITTTNGNLSLNDNTTFTQDPVTQYHLRGLPWVDLSNDSYRNLSQPLHAKQLQRDFCSTAQKEDLINDYKNRDTQVLQQAKDYADQLSQQAVTKSYVDQQDQTIKQQAYTYTDQEVAKINSKSLVEINNQNPSVNQELNLQQVQDIKVPFRSIWADPLKENFSTNQKATMNIQSGQELYTEAILNSYGYTDDKILENKNTNSLDEINTKNPLKGNLTLTNANNQYNVFVNDVDVAQSSQQVVNVNSLKNNNTLQQLIVDGKINTSKQDLKSYIDSADGNLQSQIDGKASKSYVDSADNNLQGQIDNLPTKTYVNDKALAASQDAYNNSKSYTDTSLNNYARLDNNPQGTIKTTGGSLSLSDQTQSLFDPVSQYHLYGLPNVDMSSTNFREKSQPLSARQLQVEFCSTAQKESLISDYKSRDDSVLQQSKDYTDTKTNTLTSKTYVDSQDTSVLNSAKQYTDNSIVNLPSKSYVDTQDTSLSNRITTLESNTNQIKNSTGKSKIICSGDNQIDLYSNNNNLGYFYQPIGQSDNNFGIMALKKLQFQSQLSSTSIYGSKPLDTSGLVLNTHGFYVTGIDSNLANVQSMLGIQQGDVQGNFAVGHLLDGTKYSIVSASNNLTLTGGLSPQTTDKYLTIYSASNKTSASKMGSFEFNDFAVYSQNFTPTNSLQLIHKGYLDTNYYTTTQGDSRYYLNTTKLNSITLPTSSLNLNSQKIINLLDPTLAQDACTKNYTDSNFYNKTTTLNNFALPTSSLNMNSQKITGLLAGTLTTDAVNMSQIANFITQSSADFRYVLQSTPLSSLTAPSATLNMNGNKISNCGLPTLDNDVVTLTYFNNNKGVGISKLSQLTIDQSLNLQGLYKVINCLEPTIGTDVSTKSYTDNLVTNSLINYYTKTQVDTSLSGKLSSNSSINNLAIQTADYSANNFKLTNVADPVNNKDVVNKQYLQSVLPSFSASNSITITIEAPTGNTNYTLTHNLGYTMSQLDFRVTYQIKTAVAGYVVGETISSDYNDSDRSNNGQGSGVLFYDQAISDSNNVYMRTNTSAAFYSTNRTGGSTILDIPWANVRILVYLTQKTSPLVLQANSMNTSQITVNSNVDLGTYKFLTSATTFTGNEIPNVNWITSNVQVGTPAKIQNATTTTSSITANQTEITLGSTQLNMNNQKIINCANGVNTNDVVNYGQLTSYSPSAISNSTSNLTIGVANSTLTCSNNTAIQINNSSRNMDFYSNSFQIYNTLLSNLFSVNTTQTLSYKKMKISTSSASQLYPLYIDSSSYPNATQLYINNTGTNQYGIEVINGDIKCRNIVTDNSFTTPSITSTNITNSGDITTNNINASSSISSSYCYLQNPSTVQSILDVSMGSVIKPAQNSLITSHTDVSGYYGFFSKNWILSSNFQTYTPGSSRNYKRDISEIQTDRLIDVDFRRYYYDETKCNQYGIQADYSRENFGIVIEELPQEIKQKYCYTHGDNNDIWTVDLTRLKDDVLQYHQKTIREQQQRINYLENQLRETNRKVEGLLQFLNISI